MMQNGMADVLAGAGVNIPTQADMDEGDRKTNLIVNYLPQTMTQVTNQFYIRKYNSLYYYFLCHYLIFHVFYQDRFHSFKFSLIQSLEQLEEVIFVSPLLFYELKFKFS